MKCAICGRELREGEKALGKGAAISFRLYGKNKDVRMYCRVRKDGKGGNCVCKVCWDKFQDRNAVTFLEV